MTTKLERITVKLQDLLPNPFRSFINKGRTRKADVDRLVASMEKTGWWDNLLVRKSPANSSKFECGFGENRRIALLRLHTPDFEIHPVCGNYTDAGMLSLLIADNSYRSMEQPDRIELAGLLKQYLVNHPEACERVTGNGERCKEHGSTECISAFAGHEDWPQQRVSELLSLASPGEAKGSKPVNTPEPKKSATETSILTVKASIPISLRSEQPPVATRVQPAQATATRSSSGTNFPLKFTSQPPEVTTCEDCKAYSELLRVPQDRIFQRINAMKKQLEIQAQDFRILTQWTDDAHLRATKHEDLANRLFEFRPQAEQDQITKRVHEQNRLREIQQENEEITM